jgi:hypothetical protein
MSLLKHWRFVLLYPCSVDGRGRLLLAVMMTTKAATAKPPPQPHPQKARVVTSGLTVAR